MELLGRLGAVVGISLVLTLLLLVLYQDEGIQAQQGSAVTQISASSDHGAP
ncbi:MAG TPA: hypothetical protein VF491_14340 [Vicinamibacterales bacterium]